MRSLEKCERDVVLRELCATRAEGERAAKTVRPCQAADGRNNYVAGSVSRLTIVNPWSSRGVVRESAQEFVIH